MTALHEQTQSFVSYLASHPSMDRVAQFLVMELLAEFDARGALLASFDSNGVIQPIGSFGLPVDVVEGMRRLSVWDHTPLSDAIRNGIPLVVDSGDGMRTAYPWLSEHEALLQASVTWPLVMGGERLGSLQVQFGDRVSLDPLAPFVAEYLGLLALYVGLAQHADGVGNLQSRKNGHRHETLRHNGDADLTARQMTVLRLLAQGMTNPQIASRIGFSDSTVRQETMSIYRFLGADGRRDATRIAMLRGLLAEPDPAPSV